MHYSAPFVLPIAADELEALDPLPAYAFRCEQIKIAFLNPIFPTVCALPRSQCITTKNVAGNKYSFSAGEMVIQLHH